MKSKTILIGFLTLICYAVSTQAQMRSDFVLFSQGFDPDLAFDAQNRLHATMWTRDRNAYYGLFDSMGQEIIAPKKISTFPNALIPKLAVNEDHVVVVWVAQGIDGSEIMGRLLTVDGDSVSGNVEFTDYDGVAAVPDVTFLNDSTFIVIWTGDEGIYGQIATTSIRLLGSNMLLSDHPIPDVIYGSPQGLSRASTEDFVVVWRDDHSGSQKVFGRMFFSDGTPKNSSFLISEDDELSNLWFVSAGMDTSGNFAVVWGAEKASHWIIQWRRFQSDGTPFGPSEKVNSSLDVGESYPLVDVSNVNGKCVIVWTQKENGFSKIFAQRFLEDGTALGNNFRVSTSIDTFAQSFPSIVLHEDKIYTAWEKIDNSTTTSRNIWASILDFNDPTLEVENPNEGTPQSFHLFQNYPNPFNPNTAIKFETRQRSQIRLVIYNVLGEEIITLENEEVMPGIHEVQWNGKNSEGNPVPSGIYFYRLQEGDYAQTKKMVFIQ